MAALLLADRTIMDDATFLVWRREYATPKFLQEENTQSFCEVMGVLLLADVSNNDGRCDIPPLEEGMCYTQVSAGVFHSVLLRSDGSAVACGLNDEGQCNIPVFTTGSYLFDCGKDYILQVDIAFKDDAWVLTCCDLAGHEVLGLRANESDLAWDTHKRIARDLQVNLQSLRLNLPDGQFLASICWASPLATIADLSEG